MEFVTDKDNNKMEKSEFELMDKLYKSKGLHRTTYSNQEYTIKDMINTMKIYVWKKKKLTIAEIVLLSKLGLKESNFR